MPPLLRLCLLTAALSACSCSAIQWSDSRDTGIGRRVPPGVDQTDSGSSCVNDAQPLINRKLLGAANLLCAGIIAVRDAAILDADGRRNRTNGARDDNVPISISEGNGKSRWRYVPGTVAKSNTGTTRGARVNTSSINLKSGSESEFPVPTAFTIRRSATTSEGADNLTRYKLEAGTKVVVTEEKLDTKTGITYLKLADHRGWVFDKNESKEDLFVREGKS